MHTRTIAYFSLAAITAAMLSGCGTTIPLAPQGASAGARVAVIDKRDKAETVYRRDGVMEPIQYFGDEDFEVPPLTHLGKALERTLPAKDYTLEVSKFRVIDIFPRRMNAGVSGATAGALSSLGYSAFLPYIDPKASDNITCIAAGKVQGQAFAQSASVPYAISPFAGLVKKDSAFAAAVNGCFTQLAEQVSKSL